MRSSVALGGEDLKTIGDFSLEAGRTVAFTLTYAPSHLPPPEPVEPAHALAKAEQFWTKWSERAIN